jgi:hypothetical protein
MTTESGAEKDPPRTRMSSNRIPAEESCKSRNDTEAGKKKTAVPAQGITGQSDAAPNHNEHCRDQIK